MAVIKIVPMPGAEGQQGDTGATGAQGPQGPQGLQGPAGADAAWYYNGEYNPGASYVVGDVVTYEGQTWYRKNANGGNVGDTPSEGLFWDLIAAKGEQGPQGEPGSLTGAKLGSFFDTSIQTGGSIKPITLNSIDFSNGITVVDGSKITMDTLGIYNIAFSLQLEKTGGSSADIYIWMRHNGVDVADTATIIHMANNNTYNVAAWNFFVNCDVLPQDFQLMWYTASTNVSIASISDSTTPVGVPSVPSVIVTVNKVGDL